MLRATRLACVLTLSTGLGLLGPGVVSAVEVLSRGPIHEAFARPVERRTGPTLPVPKAPPAPLVELLPEQRPEGDNIRWIPGYWAWDAERKGFLWVSGVFRRLPPERVYVPGYWTKTEQRWRWVPGLWISQQLKELTYLPEPPDSVESGPHDAAPTPDSAYRPGYWRFHDDRFEWQPGGWVAATEGRVWVSPHYLWTPGGYLFVDGYTDYPLADRGQLFAPAAFATVPAYYRPIFALNLETILTTLFYRPGSWQYSFGDYFRRPDYQPWFAGAGRDAPLLGYYQWQHRADADWLSHLQKSYADRASGRAPVLPQILEGQNYTTASPRFPPVNRRYQR